MDPGDDKHRDDNETIGALESRNVIVAITPPSDIVLGVALAADPQKYRAAAERLRSSSAAAGAEFDASAWQASVAPTTQVADADVASPVAPSAAPGQPRQARSTADAFGQLEAVVLQTFIQSMLPKNANHVFGKGIAGDIWKSMLAEKLANEVARSGQVGLAKRLQAGTAIGRLQAVAPGAAAIAPPASLASVLPYLQQPAPAVGPTPPEGAKS
jgi:flagellar protein FlgJ